MAYALTFSIGELVANLKSLSSPEVGDCLDNLTFAVVKDNFLDVVKNRYFCFEGTADRREFWQYAQVMVIISIIPIIGYLAALALLPATIGVTTRRLHDIGKSGWLQLLDLIPIIGLIIVLTLCIGKTKSCGCGCGE